MMPIVWFYVALVLVLWLLLAYVEMQRREHRKVRGCLELDVISADKLWSLMVMEPLLVVVELRPDTDVATDLVLIRGAIPVPISVLEDYLKTAAPGQRFAFYSRLTNAIPWERVDCAVCGAGLKKGYVLQGGIDLWRKSRLPLDAAVQRAAS
jgi:hypothetical protein